MERNEVDKNAMGGTELMGAGLEKYVDKDLLSKFQIIRSRVRGIDPDRTTILWLHDLPQDPESLHLADPMSRARFKKIICVSNWQMQMYNAHHRIPYSECVVLKNAIDPISAELIDKRSDKIKLIYTPTPHRGLKILLPVFDALCRHHDNLELDVFSSFALYGWAERDQEFADLIEYCKNHPKINYHGSQPNEVVREALAKSHIFAYPSIWMETSSICTMEAMSAGNLVVTPNLAALPETTAGYAMMYQYDEDLNVHANRFFQVLNNAIMVWKNAQKSPEDAAGLQNHLNLQKSHADYMYCWERRAQEWTALLSEMAPPSPVMLEITDTSKAKEDEHPERVSDSKS